MGMGTANQAYLMTQSNPAQGHSPQDTRQRLIALAYKLRFHALRRPLAAVGAVLAVGVLLGAGGRSAVGLAEVEAMQATDASRQAELDKVRREAQHEVNALAARLAELQAQANRLNALGARLTRSGQLQDGEFEFDKPVGQGGAGRASVAARLDLRDLRVGPAAADVEFSRGRLDQRPLQHQLRDEGADADGRVDGGGHQRGGAGVDLGHHQHAQALRLVVDVGLAVHQG